MLRDRKQEYLTALILVGPFVLIYGVLFVWPTIQMVMLSFTKAPLIGSGAFVGWDNYVNPATTGEIEPADAAVQMRDDLNGQL